MEGASHCVYLDRVFAASLPLFGLDWILTFSSFRFIFPVQFSRCVLGSASLLGCRSYAAAVQVVSSPLVGLAASLVKNLSDPSKRYSVSIKNSVSFVLQLFAAVAFATLFFLLQLC